MRPKPEKRIDVSGPGALPSEPSRGATVGAAGREAAAPVLVDGLKAYRFPALTGWPGLFHAVFSRHGGIGRPPFDTFNLARGVGDAPEAVDGNRRRLHRALGGGRLVLVRQVHGTGVVRVDAAPPGGETHPFQHDAGEGDALVTDRPGLWLTILVADCQAVLLFDPVLRVVANVHAGWRGAVAGIVGRTVSAMVDGFGCEPRRLLAAIGPSLGPCCAEFVHYRREIPQGLWHHMGPGRRLDLWAVTREDLSRSGVRPGNISQSGLCTRCRTDEFFSYRGERRTGRFAAVIGLVPDRPDRHPGKG